MINRLQRPHYDLAIAWGGASGWARGTDSKGRTVLLIAVSDPYGIVRQVTGSLAAGLEGNCSTFGTPLVIPVGVVDADELDNVEELLGKYLDQGTHPTAIGGKAVQVGSNNFLTCRSSATGSPTVE